MPWLRRTRSACRVGAQALTITLTCSERDGLQVKVTPRILTDVTRVTGNEESIRLHRSVVVPKTPESEDKGDPRTGAVGRRSDGRTDTVEGFRRMAGSLAVIHCDGSANV